MIIGCNLENENGNAFEILYGLYLETLYVLSVLHNIKLWVCHFVEEGHMGDTDTGDRLTGLTEIKVVKTNLTDTHCPTERPNPLLEVAAPQTLHTSSHYDIRMVSDVYVIASFQLLSLFHNP